jgi:proteasome lid subunit RPN8/RPN11
MRITRDLLEKLIELCGGAHPREVGGLLLGKKKTLEANDFVIIPGRFQYSSIYIHMDRIPIYPNLIGTFHSHPSPNSRPSGADLDLFGRLGKVHLIFAYPYDLNSIGVYESSGKPSKLEIA